MAQDLWDVWFKTFENSVKMFFPGTSQETEKASNPEKSSHSFEELESEIASFPKTTVYENEILELYRYGSGGKAPLLVVNPLINGYYILDLLPELSLIAYLVGQEIPVYLIRWKNIEQYHREYTFDYYVEHGVKESVEQVFLAEQKPLILAGHCLGGLLASAYLSAGKDSKISKYLSLNAPCDLSRLGKIREMALFLQVDQTVDFFGNIPAEQMKFIFQMINPALKMQAMSAIFMKSDPGFLRAYKALLKWREDHINMPGEFARTLLKDFFQENRLFEEKLKVLGKKASLTKIKIPVLNVMSDHDDIAPLSSCEALKEKIPHAEEMRLPDGHLAIILLPVMGQEVTPFWETLVRWIVA